MKISFLFSLLAASAVYGVAIPHSDAPLTKEVLAKRQFQFIGTVTSLLGKGGKVADPRGAAPKRVTLQPSTSFPQAQRVKLRYGPYMVVNVNNTSLVGESGMLWNYPDLSIDKPCTQCVLLSQVAGLEYPDGRNANIDSGLWLHHMVHFVHGTNRWDPTCVNRQSLPHVDVGDSSSRAERYFSSGNERTHVPYNLGPGKNAQQSGYALRSNDRFSFIVDLMNMNTQDATVYMTMTYEFINGGLPNGWMELKTVWFDVNQCGTSEAWAKSQNGAYVLTSSPWIANFQGPMMGIGGHLHDGGTKLDIEVGGRVMCSSVARYGESPEFRSTGHGGMEGMNMGGSGGGGMLGGIMNMVGLGGLMGGGGGGHSVAPEHISTMTVCDHTNATVNQVQSGTSWVIKGYYDYRQHAGNIEGGSQANVMAISLMYVGIPAGGIPQPSGGGFGGLLGFFS